MSDAMETDRDWLGWVSMQFLVRFVHAALVVVVGLAIGKMCQYTAIEYLEDRLGFNIASIIGIVPFITLLVYLKVRHPRWLAYRPATIAATARSARSGGHSLARRDGSRGDS